MYENNAFRSQTQAWIQGLPWMMVLWTVFGTLFLLFTCYGTAMAEDTGVHEITKGTTGGFVMVKADDPWQPEGFAEALILRAAYTEETPAIDGQANDPAWDKTAELTIPLAWGDVNEAKIKAVYDSNDVYLLVSWADPGKDDQYRPWVWDEGQGRYVEGPQLEDALLVSIEGGCDWNPSLLAGHVFDFDGWLWLAARSDPVGQAIDVDGGVQDRMVPDLGYHPYQSRYTQPGWDLKIVDWRPDILNAPWQDLERQYKRTTPLQEIFVRYQPDGRPAPAFTDQLPPPAMTDNPEMKLQNTAAIVPPPMVPQYRPIKLAGDAGEVSAKGHWQDGRWTVEFKRARVTPARTSSDSTFLRTTQFSIHVFNQTEQVDKASESPRLLLEFEPAGEWPTVVDNSKPAQ